MTVGVILLNIGTPDSTHTKDVQRYLNQFLMDPKVVTLPWIARFILVRLLITPQRAPESAKSYRKIWTKAGSPLLVHSKALRTKLQTQLGSDYTVELGMRYGTPSIEAACSKLSHCEHIILAPLFPQFADAATGSALAKAEKLLKGKSIQALAPFYDAPEFIQAQAEPIRTALNPDSFLLLSYHGLPEKQLKKIHPTICEGPCPVITDFNENCYRAQCYATSRALASALKLRETQYTTSFQSRLGKLPWIKPYTTDILAKLATRGVKKLVVACPAFTADCLETLEEIGMAAKAQWLELGGTDFTLVSAVNSSDTWVSGLSRLLTTPN